MKVKQSIVIRSDLNMRRGKEIAQGSHASILWLVWKLRHAFEGPFLKRILNLISFILWPFSTEEWAWMIGLFAKICLQVHSEAELDAIYEAAKKAGLTVYMVTDSGKTEFNGVPTKTCLAIGPHEVSRIDAITRGLKLY